MRVAPITSRFLDACRRRPTDFRPVWFMRQAGRYLRQYREIRARHGILEICKRPDLAATVTLQPVEILDVDAAIVNWIVARDQVQQRGLATTVRADQAVHLAWTKFERDVVHGWRTAEGLSDPFDTHVRLRHGYWPVLNRVHVRVSKRV